MNPTDTYTRAFKAFYAEPTNLDFHQICEQHLTAPYAYVLRTNRCFLLAREVDASWSEKTIVDECLLACASSHLHVTLAVGDLSEFTRMIPEHIKTISFQKRGYKLHMVPVDRLKAFEKKALNG